jgi:hypothetical protein
MCQNTLSALQQVLEAMEEEGASFVDGLSKEEKRAYDRLYDAAQAFQYKSEWMYEEN